jgi:ABC-type polysaccharide/polyol phosphate export permease
VTDATTDPARRDTGSGTEHVFVPHARVVPPVREYLDDAWARRHFVVAKAKADLRGARSRTVLGELWAIADPLFQAFVYWFVIKTIRSSSGDETERLIILISGIFLWSFSTTIVAGGGRSIVRNRSLVLNTIFPRILLPATELYKGILDLGAYLGVYVLIHLLLGGPVGVGLFMVPLLLVLQVGISMGLAMLFATLTVFIADMSNVLEYIMRILFFTTPILYPVALLPPLASTLLQLNPFFALFACYQAAFTGGVPSIGYLLQACFWAALLSYVGFRVFVSNERGFALRL